MGKGAYRGGEAETCDDQGRRLLLTDHEEGAKEKSLISEISFALAAATLKGHHALSRSSHILEPSRAVSVLHCHGRRQW